jgi:hypothetical protein
MMGHLQKGEPAMIDRAHPSIRSGFAGIARHLVLRSLVTSTLLVAAIIALSATSPSWADRIWSDAAAVKASVSKNLFHVAYRHDASRDVGPDDYVQGLVKLGITSPRS